MTHIDIFLILLFGAIILVISFVFSMLNELAGINHFFSWLKVQLVSFAVRGKTTNSEKDRQAIQATLNICDDLKKVNLDAWNFKTETFSLIEKIASIYHPYVTTPIEQARLGDVCDAVHEANQKVLKIINLPRINYVTQFRVIQVFESLYSSSRNNSENRQPNSLLKRYFLRPFFLIWQKRIVRSLLIQWILLVGEAALKIYGSNFDEGEVEAETILKEWDDLQGESEVILPENINEIAESSKKKILLSTTSVSWKQAGQIYFTLTDQIARYYHSESSCPFNEVRICD